jgi:RNA polymerase sigma factor (sigma-70 family)
MTDDAELLRRFADDRSDDAFSEVVRRHVDLVYSSALRQAWGDHHRAQEITQMVFVTLARKAARLASHPVLPAWLHRASRLAALEINRKEARRHKYERAAGAEILAGTDGEEHAAWEEVRPVLDAAINRLNERDRQAILLRFFAKQSLGEIAQRLELSENAARMRVERALAKLHVQLIQQGIKSSAAALVAAITGNAIVAAPAGVAAASTSAAMAVGGGAGIAWVAFMSTSKLPVALTVAILAGGSAIVAVQHHSALKAASEIANLTRQNDSIAGLKEENQRLEASAEQARNLVESVAAIGGGLKNRLREAEDAAAMRTAAASRKGPRIAALPSGVPVIPMSNLDQRPVVTSQHAPAYPAEMRYAGGEGEAVIEFVVGQDGLVYEPSAISSTDPAFAAAAVDAVSQWVFKPGQVGGQNVYTRMQVPIVFKISPAAPSTSGSSWF